MDSIYRQELFISSVKLVTTDKGFDLPSENAQKARLIAYKMLTAVDIYDDAHQESVAYFTSWLFEEIQACGTHPRAITCHTFKERIWERFYKLSTQDSFRRQWADFIQKMTGLDANPMFYQFVTKSIFEQLIKFQLPTLPTGDLTAGTSQPALDYNERNALRYCGGYIIRSLTEKLEKSSLSDKEDLIQCLGDLIEDDDDVSDVESADSAKWLSTVNRGGLVKICDSFFHFLVAIEDEVRKTFPAASPDTNAYTDEDLKTRAIEIATNSENVKFHWEILSVNWCSTTSQTLLAIILKHYVTIRGFSFTKGFMEKYKQLTKKNLQKSKGLRKNILAKND